MELTERQKANRLKKELARIEEEKKQRQVKSLTITIEWKKSYTWGMNPNASVDVEYKDGDSRFYRDSGFKCSGCGYDKESTVIAEIFNKYLKYKLHDLHIELNAKDTNKEIPYGIDCYRLNNPHYSGGVGTSCYYHIAKFIGGKFENITNGKTFGVFKYTDNE